MSFLPAGEGKTDAALSLAAQPLIETLTELLYNRLTLSGRGRKEGRKDGGVGHTTETIHD